MKGYVLAYNELIDASYTCLLISRRVTSGCNTTAPGPSPFKDLSTVDFRTKYHKAMLTRFIANANFT